MIDVSTIPEIKDNVYAMGKAIAFKPGIKQPKRNGTGGNMLKMLMEETKEIKELRRWLARTSNELFRRKVRRKLTKK